MISKRIDRKKGQPSSYSKLVDYLLSDKGLDEGERVVHTWIRNCITDDIDLSKKEVEATQAMNQRVQSDKTYHLVLSFREADELNKDQMMEIEEYFCQALGYGEHQRISVVHGDTNNQHIHIAINKLHPETFKLLDPFQDKRRMQEMCRAMEKKFGLELEPNRKEKSHTLESYGFQSFESWLKENAKEEILSALETAESWSHLQATCAKFDVEFRKSGSGLAISHRSESLYVKASSIDRSLSYKRLAERFGEFMDESRGQAIEAKMSYKKAPTSEQSMDLWSEYLSYKDHARKSRSDVLDGLKNEKNQSLITLKNRIRDKKIAVRVSPSLNWVQKKAERSRIAAEHIYKRSLIDEEYAEKRKQLSENNKVLGWPDWLHERSKGGDLEALAALQKVKRKPSPSRTEAFVSGKISKDYLAGISFDIKRNGEVHYKVGGSVVIDQGNGVRLQSGASKEAIDFAVELSRQRFGSKLKVEGERDLCQRINQRLGLGVGM